VADAGAKMTPRLLRRLKEAGLRRCASPTKELIGRYAALRRHQREEWRIYVEAGQEITQAVLDLFDENASTCCRSWAIDHTNVGPTSATRSLPTKTPTVKRRCSMSIG